MKSRMNIFLILIAIGAVSGYVILHPASLLIMNIFEKKSFDIGRIFIESFALIHIAMSVFFMLLGGIMGLVFSLYINLENRFYTELTNINKQLDKYNREIISKMNHGSEDLTLFVKQLWPTLNKIQQGVDLILEDESKLSKVHKSNILSVTKDNISSLFELINTMLTAETKKGF